MSTLTFLVKTGSQTVESRAFRTQKRSPREAGLRAALRDVSAGGTLQLRRATPLAFRETGRGREAAPQRRNRKPALGSTQAQPGAFRRPPALWGGEEGGRAQKPGARRAEGGWVPLTERGKESFLITPTPTPGAGNHSICAFSSPGPRSLCYLHGLQCAQSLSQLGFDPHPAGAAGLKPGMPV
ncbi:Hypothetical predicted protein [Marmota monax]|uniref:Uncharacterized protein n=1 Tax=Marmota monax TaxID=9995 RepID=A0A5E4CF33_MARMO|nr:hypothetical protein GHT09_001883 [Marmota monax]VTJ80395.1 Hypothetical predicted protein [Marmota monax]